MMGCGRRESQPQPAISIAALAGSLSHLAVYTAHSLGFFAQEGPRVELEALNSSAKTMEALLGGSIDAAAATYNQLLLVRQSSGRDLQSFFVLSLRPSQVLAAAPGVGDIRNVKDLEGRTVGVMSVGSASHQDLTQLLFQQGADISRVRVAAIGSAASAVAALETRKVDAAMLLSLAFETLRARHPEVRAIVDLRSAEGTRQLHGVSQSVASVMVARTEWLSRNQAAARAVAKALARAGRWIRNTRLDQVEPKLPAAFRTPGSQAGQNALRAVIEGLSADGRMPPEAPEAVRRYLVRAGSLTSEVDLAKTYTNSYLENP